MTKQPAYATVEDLKQYNGEAPDSIGATQLLIASAQVDRMLLTAIYATDSEGMPTGIAEREAVRNATCAQALYAESYGSADEIAAEPGAMSLGPLSISGRRGSNGGGGTPVWSQTAIDFLVAAGLIVGPVLT